MHEPLCYTDSFSTLCQQSLCQSKIPQCKHLSIQWPQIPFQWQQWKCTKHGQHPFIDSRSYAALSFWDPLLLPTLCSILLGQQRGRFPCFSGLLFFLWLDIKVLGLCLFLWVVEQCLANKKFYWDGCHRGWMLALNGRTSPTRHLMMIIGPGNNFEHAQSCLFAFPLFFCLLPLHTFCFQIDYWPYTILGAKFMDFHGGFYCFTVYICSFPFLTFHT